MKVLKIIKIKIDIKCSHNFFFYSSFDSKDYLHFRINKNISGGELDLYLEAHVAHTLLVLFDHIAAILFALLHDTKKLQNKVVQ